MPVVSDLADLEHRDRVRPHERVQAFAQPVRSERLA